MTELATAQGEAQGGEPVVFKLQQDFAPAQGIVGACGGLQGGEQAQAED